MFFGDTYPGNPDCRECDHASALLGESGGREGPLLSGVTGHRRVLVLMCFAGRTATSVSRKARRLWLIFLGCTVDGRNALMVQTAVF